MNREIKFRGLSLETGEWVYGDLVIYRNCGNVHFINGIAVDEDTTCQYIGINDPNDVEIYGRDIVMLDNALNKYVVNWDNEKLHYFLWSTKNIDDEVYFGDFVLSDLEVIGNIYDNPELLKEE